jgi:hypothetical protein
MFTNLSQDDAVTVAWWWCLAVMLNVLAAVLAARMVVVLGAANPSSPLAWIGRAATVPGRVVVLQMLVLGATTAAMTCVRRLSVAGISMTSCGKYLFGLWFGSWRWWCRFCTIAGCGAGWMQDRRCEPEPATSKVVA